MSEPACPYCGGSLATGTHWRETGREYEGAPYVNESCGTAKAANPRCVLHGEMRYRPAGKWWVCPGWDGEGCCAFEAERLGEDMALVEPVPGWPPSRHGFRLARPAG